MAESTWDQLVAVLRQIGELKRSGVTGAAVETLVEEAWDLWPEVPEPSPANPRVWPPDVLALARELGFARSASSTEELDPMDLEEASDAGAPLARPSSPPPMPGAPKPDDTLRMSQLEKAIDAAIAEGGGVGNLRVACSPERIVLSGIAADEESRDQALLAAAKLAPGIEIEDAIDVA